MAASRSDVEDVLKETFKQTDEQLIAEMKQRDITSGSTAAVALLLNNTLFAAWTGPSSASVEPKRLICHR